MRPRSRAIWKQAKADLEAARRAGDFHPDRRKSAARMPELENSSMAAGIETRDPPCCSNKVTEEKSPRW